MRPLDGQRVALLESRKAADVAAMVQRLGGTAICAPSVREVPRDADIRPVLARLIADDYDLVVLLTAAASDALLAEADRHGLLAPVVAAFRRTTVACRGPKPMLSLRRHGLIPQVVTDKPHTTDELLASLAPMSLAGANVLLLHYGEPSSTVSSALVSGGATVEDLCLYDWALPEDVTPLEALIADTLAGRIDVMLFTSQIQFRHLFDVASAMQVNDALTVALREHVIVGAVGPVCARAIRASGIVPDVMPRAPNGPSLIQALADYLAMFNDPESTPG
jgi:uroporphyrinogen-III synthase